MLPCHSIEALAAIGEKKAKYFPVVLQSVDLEPAGASTLMDSVQGSCQLQRWGYG